MSSASNYVEGVWSDKNGAGEMGLCLRSWGGRGRDRVVCKPFGAMGRVRERWGGIRGHGQGQGAVGRHAGPWAGSGSGGEAYWAMGRVRERWEGILGHGQGPAILIEW